MTTVNNDKQVFKKDVTFGAGVTFEGDTPVFSLTNIDSLDISGNLVAAGSGHFGTDLYCGDDLTVIDDASIGGDLNVTGVATMADANLSGDLFLSGNASINGDSVLSTLAVNGAFTCSGGLSVNVGGAVIYDGLDVHTGATTCQAITAAGAIIGATTLAVAGASTLHNTSVIGTLGVSAATTLAACSSTALSASTSLTLTGASVVGLDEYVTLDIPTLVGTGVYGLPSPAAGTIVKIQSWLKGALSTGDATLTGKIGNTAITNGALTITQVGSARADIDVANPTAANTVAVGSDINFTVGGTNATAVGATVVITIRRSA